jgi:hypothetical protein
LVVEQWGFNYIMPTAFYVCMLGLLFAALNAIIDCYEEKVFCFLTQSHEGTFPGWSLGTRESAGICGVNSLNAYAGA